MEFDSVHSTVERMGATNKMYSPYDWYTVARACRRDHSYELVEMAYHNFKDYKKSSKDMIKNKNQTNTGEKISWLKLKWICYTKEDTDATYVKEHLNEPTFKQVPLILTRRMQH